MVLCNRANLMELYSTSVLLYRTCNSSLFSYIWQSVKNKKYCILYIGYIVLLSDVYAYGFISYYA